MSNLVLQNNQEPITLTEKFAVYMIQSLLNKLGSSNIVCPTYDLGYEILKDCEMIVGQVHRAYTNPIYLPWSIEEYATRLTPAQNLSTTAREARIRTEFPPLFSNANEDFPLQVEPCTVVDSRGVIVLWHLPEALSQTRNDVMVSHISQLHSRFKASLPREGQMTRRKQGYKPEGTTLTSPGHIPFSPCWYNIAKQLTVSRSLRGWPTSDTIQYLGNDRESLSLVGAVIALVHPRQASQGLSILRGIYTGIVSNEAIDTLGPELGLWPCPFSAFSLLSNRETDLHRDGKGFNPYYDITTTLGNYTNGRFEVPGIGLRFQYNPGSMIAIAGKVLAHGVAEVDGDRFCHVQYVHRRVLDLMCGYPVSEEPSHWMRQDDLNL